MKYKIEICVDDKNIQELLKSEYQTLKKRRFETSMQKEKLIVRADDAIALRAVINSIMNTIVIYEKLKVLKNE